MVQLLWDRCNKQLDQNKSREMSIERPVFLFDSYTMRSRETSYNAKQCDYKYDLQRPHSQRYTKIVQVKK